MLAFKKILSFAVLIVTSLNQVKAQNFISKAQVEYEVRTNIKKTMGTGFWAEMIKDKIPDFKTSYFNYTFNDNKSIYKFDHWPPNTIPSYIKEADEASIWYCDFDKDEIFAKKNVIGGTFFIKDSLRKIDWKLTNENMVIAGFNCRKAEAVIFDSVYIFAYYSEELMISGGPASINGLPGLILGLTIPRMYTSYVATKISVNDVPINIIKPFNAKKTITYTGLKNDISSRMKDWGSDDDEEETLKNRQMTLWNVQL